MKKITISILSAVALCFLSSCDAINGAIDRYPLDTVSPGSYFKDADQLETYLNKCYESFFSYTLYENENDIYFKKNLTMLQRGGIMRTASNQGGWDFSALRHINTMFSYIDNCNDEAVKKEYIALARFFRAYYYFNMVRDFGDVPWIDHELSSDEATLYAPRDSRDVVMEHMIEDIDVAIEGLPETVTSKYRVNKWTALAFKSRFCLFEGTWRVYHANDKYKVEGKHDANYYLDLAAQAAKEFMDNSPYGIYNTGNPNLDYRVLFATQDANDTEIVLAKNYSLALSYSHFASWTTCQENSLSINKKFVNMYLMADGSRFTDKAGWETMTYNDEVKDRDPRMAQTMRLPGYQRFDCTDFSDYSKIAYSDSVRVPQISNTLSGYQSVKFDQGLQYCPDTWTATDADLPVFRAAEVLLNYAEAKAESGSITQDDLDKSINVLRKRAGMPDLNLAVANSNPDNNYLGSAKYGYANVKGANKGVILEIRRERAIELAQEGEYRWYDLMRWKEGQCMSQKYLGMYFPGTGEYDFNNDGKMDLCIYDGDKPATTALESYKLNSEIYLSEGTSGYLNYIEAKKVSHTFNENRDYLKPIPPTEIALNNKLIQNPGWE